MMRMVRGKLTLLMVRLKDELQISYHIWGAGHYSGRCQYPDHLRTANHTRIDSLPLAGVDPPPSRLDEE